VQAMQATCLTLNRHEYAAWGGFKKASMQAEFLRGHATTTPERLSLLLARRLVSPIYESSLRAGHGWQESLYRHQGCLKASDCGRLGRQAAGHPWSALRVVKSCRKDCLTAKMLLEAKAAALYPEQYQNLLSKLSTKKEGEAGKRSAGNRIS
jgi:hypothetical protein